MSEYNKVTADAFAYLMCNHPDSMTDLMAMGNFIERASTVSYSYENNSIWFGRMHEVIVGLALRFEMFRIEYVGTTYHVYGLPNFRIFYNFYKPLYEL